MNLYLFNFHAVEFLPRINEFRISNEGLLIELINNHLSKTAAAMINAPM